MTIMGITLSAAVIWLVVAIVFAVIEAATMGIATVWFAIGAAAAAVCAMLGAPVIVQVIVFAVISLVLLYFTRPLVKNKLKVGSEKTNIDSLIGKQAVVTAEIPEMGTGEVRVNGLAWTAVSADPHQVITEGSVVKIDDIEGVKLIVSSV